MIDPKNDIAEEFTVTPDHEFQDSHYHDEEPDVVDDDVGEGMSDTPKVKKKTNRRVPPRPRYYED